jgi:thymidylate synthase (FAD)
VNKIALITEPTIIVLGETQLDEGGLSQLRDWVAKYRPECLPDEDDDLFPHNRTDGNGRALTGSELLTELSGRNCYHSYGRKAGRTDNAEYIGRMLFPDDPKMLPHASVAYHAKMTFFVAGVSRRVSHELIRHYVGADRSEEGSPSQESTRYTFHPGHFAVPPYMIDAGPESVRYFYESMEIGYSQYLGFIRAEEAAWEHRHGEPPKAIDRKRIYEAAAGLLPMQACTSFVWTTNPLALGKLFRERCSPAADREFQRFAVAWRDVAMTRWPHLFRE